MQHRPIRRPLLATSAVAVTFVALGSAPALALPRGAECVADAKLAVAGIDSADAFGTSVAIDGDVIVVGAKSDENGGSARVFRKIDGQYVPEATLKSSHTDGLDQFGAAVDVSGDVIIVGAPNDQQADGGSGSVSIFRKINGTWTEEFYDQGPVGLPIYQFGRAVQIVGDTAVVGHQLRSGAALRVLERVAGTWTESVQLPAGGAGDGFGEQVSFDGTTAASGSWVANAPGNANTQTGRLDTFRKVGGVWIAEPSIFPPVLDMFTRFGTGVSVQGDRMLVGAGGEDSDGNLAGALYTYVRNGGQWVFEQKLTPPDGAPGRELGYAVALDDPWLVAGDPKYSTSQSGSNAGRAILFHRGSSGWEFAQSIFPQGIGAQDSMGGAVALGGGIVAAGAVGDDDSGVNAGTVWLRGVNVTDCDRNGQTDACDIAIDPMLDCDHDGQLDSCEMTYPFRVYTPTYTPLQFGVVHTYVLSPTPRAEGPVSITCDGFSQTGGDKVVHVRINGTPVGSVFGSYVVFNCSPVQGSLVIPASTYNNLVTPGTATEFKFLAASTIPPCTDSFLDVRIGYLAHSLDDANFNFVLDTCEGCDADFNGDQVVDAKDLAILLGGWGGSQYDLNGDGTVNAIDLAIVCGTWGACVQPG
ncbi:MAG: dockerin type I domain-containing protein [Phycisphaerales bacterium]